MNKSDSKWISIENGLPSDMEKIDVVVSFRGVCSRVADCFFKNGKFLKAGTKGEWNNILGVTHWMRIPELPGC